MVSRDQSGVRFKRDRQLPGHSLCNLGFLRETGTPENKSEFDEAVMAAFGGAQIHPVVARKMTRQYLKTAPVH